jgi:hypothetical protein
MMTYDPGLKYAFQVALDEADIADDPALLVETRRQLRADIAPYPGVPFWLEEIRDGTRVITVAKYPPEDAARIARRMRAA